MTRIAVSGASGFLGREVLRKARLRDPGALALTRSGVDDPLHRSADLRDPQGVVGLLDDVDALIHLAAAKRGGFHDQYASTVTATALLLAEAARAKVKRIVLVSSFAVYDYSAIDPGELVDEDSPIDHAGVGRDAYTQTKVLQEEIALDWAASSDVELVIARPGVVYGPGSWWTYRLGEQFGRLWLCFGGGAEVPMSFLENCADALVHLATISEVDWPIVNVFDDDPPRQRDLRRLFRRSATPRPVVVTVPWSVAARVVSVVDAFNNRRAQPLRLPGFCIPQSLAVRAKPLRYSNARLRATGWSPEISLESGLRRTFEARGGAR